jgi:ABC-2 type transport system permease protein
MRKVLAIGRVNTLRFLREGSNLFFVFLFPLMIILLLGMAYGGGFDAKVGAYVAGEEEPLAAAFVEALDGLDDISVVRYDDPDEMIDAVQRALVDGAVTVPEDYDAGLRSGAVVEVEFVARPDQTALLLRETVLEVVADQARPIEAARFAESKGLGSFDDVLPVATGVSAVAERVTVQSREAGDALFENIDQLGQFDIGASQQLVLFMFLTSLAGSAALIQTRQLGVARRMLSTPTSAATILGGETAGRYSVALTQGLYIMIGTLLIFRVDWGDPIGAPLIVIVFALVSTGAAMLMGALFSNDQQAGGLGVLIGLGLAAFGGAMAPIEIFPDTMQTVAKATPHAWAIDAFTELVRRDGTVVDILPQLGVLLAFAAVFLVLAAWRLQRVLTR